MESAAETKPPTLLEPVRVKTCGKSARTGSVMGQRGKPCLEQDKAACSVVRPDLNTRVCRLDKWLPLCELRPAKTESGLLITFGELS